MTKMPFGTRFQSGAVKVAFGFRPNSLSVSCMFSLKE